MISLFFFVNSVLKKTTEFTKKKREFMEISPANMQRTHLLEKYFRK